MTAAGHVDARNYGDSPLTRVDVPIPSTLFVSCSRVLKLAAKKVACTINLRHSFEAPLRVDRGVLAPPSQARARDLAPTLCRALMVQAATFGSCPTLQSSVYPGRNSSSTSPKAARALSWERTAKPPSQTR
jgi:hypothetical protein